MNAFLCNLDYYYYNFFLSGCYIFMRPLIGRTLRIYFHTFEFNSQKHDKFSDISNGQKSNFLFFLPLPSKHTHLLSPTLHPSAPLPPTFGCDLFYLFIF